MHHNIFVQIACVLRIVSIDGERDSPTKGFPVEGL